MNILSILNLKKSYGEKTLFQNVNFTIDSHDKVGVIGVNGTGKSSLLRILAGKGQPDAGTINHFGKIRIEYLAQTPELDPTSTVIEQVFKADTPELNLMRDYESTLAAQEQQASDSNLQKHLLALTDRIDALHLWNLKSQIETILTQLGITTFNKTISTLSGGQRKRVALASVLLSPCDLLILDEPTNHLDNVSIDWLESELKSRSGALLMVTHDRYFLDRVVQKTFELDNGTLYEYSGNYSEFVEKKAARQVFSTAIEQKRQNLYRRELAWMRRGARARTTKQKARIQRFDTIKNAEVQISDDILNINVGFTRLGKQVIKLDNITKNFDTFSAINTFSYLLGANSRIGIIGKNGSGKTTLLNIIAGKIKPDFGTITIGDTVKLGYFSQENEDMDLNLRAIEYIREGAETTQNSMGETITAAQMMELFLFDRNAQWIRISELSGGERRRLYLLRILMMAPNVLLLDEPTNDLDIDTLKILENYLDEFKGTVLTVSHDRYFLDRICHTIFSFQSPGHIITQTGNYSDFIHKHSLTPTPSKAVKPTEKYKPQHDSKPRLTWKEQQAYKTIDFDIDKMENQLDAISTEMAAATSDYTRLQTLSEEQAMLEEKLLDTMEKKETYEAILNS